MLEVHQHLLARAENLATVRAAVSDLCRRLSMPDDEVADVKLAVTEACANVVVHAYAGRPAGPLEVEAAPDGEALRVVVRDHGPGVEPRADSPGAGFGLSLIGALCDRAEVRRDPLRRVTEMVMWFRLRRAGGTVAA